MGTGEGGQMWNTGDLGVRTMTSVTGHVEFMMVYGRHPIQSGVDPWISAAGTLGRRTSSMGMQDKK